MLLLKQMAILFILMLIGYGCHKKGIINEDTSKKISAIVVNIANPAMILYGCMGTKPMKGRELAGTVLIILLIYGGLILLARIIPVLLKIPQKSRGIYKVMMIFSNIGFMGFPIISSMYGREALIYAALFTIPYNLLIYTYGIGVLSVEIQERKRESKIPLKRIFNIGVTACILALLIYLLEVPVPEVLEEVAGSLSNLTAPLSMMVIGASLAGIQMKELLSDRRLLIFAAIKLLLIPVAATLLLKAAIGNTIFTGVCMVMLSTPAGSMTAMLASQYNGDYETASKGVALTTLLSIATMPLVAMIL